MSNRDSKNNSETGLSPMRSIAIESPSAPPAGAPPRPASTPPASLSSVPPPAGVAPVQGILATGSRFGSYVVGPCVGQGGMARVYSAQHEGLQRQVALKVLTQGLVGSDEHERFVREARLAAGIKHPNVVNIFDVGVEEGVPYLVMEFLEGEDLDTSLQTETSLSEDAIIDIMVPVVAGLTAVHDAGVIHRDLKPGNIFLTRGRHDEVEPKLLDFGISRSTCRKHGKITSERGLLMGTPFYMAPETIRGADITEVSDQYSLGVVMYECATGVNPFAADSFAEVVERVTSGNYPPLSQCNTPVSPKLVRIVERAMSLNPNDRYADLREMGRDLLRLAGQRTRVTWGLTFGDISSQLATKASGVEAAPRQPSQPQELIALAGTLPPPKRRKGALFALLGAAALLSVVVLEGDAWQALVGNAPQPLVTRASLTPDTAKPMAPSSAQEEARKLTKVDPAPSPEAQAKSSEPTADSETSDNGNVDVPKPRKTARTKSRSTARKKTVRRRRRRRTARKRPSKPIQKTETIAASRPAWALGDSVEDRATGLPDLGTNNAPILD